MRSPGIEAWGALRSPDLAFVMGRAFGMGPE
jgi:hypothetical protein